ncbi:MAG: M56 family metallopeptidase, partial [Planctomycetaceae bacterium]|nr:M56 family metallopeptidase [Planctomycetaceae bacterium]
CLQLLRACNSLRAGRSLANRAQPLLSDLHPQASELLGLIDDIRNRIGLKSPLRARVTDRIDIPAVWGWFSPVLLLPAAMLTGLTVDHWRVIIAHELAHVRRFDPLIDLAQRLIEAILFFNPPLWWINRQIRREREACCDAIAARIVGESDCGDATLVASTLINVADRIATARSAPLATPAFADQSQPGDLTDRVERLVLPDDRPRLLLPWASLLGLLLLFLATLLLAERTSTYAVQIVKKIMTPAERAERISKIQSEFPAELFQIQDQRSRREQSPKVVIQGTIRTSDGKNLPEMFGGTFMGTSKHRGSVIVSGVIGAEFRNNSGHVARFSHSLERYDEYRLMVDIPGYALCISEPISPSSDDRPVSVDLVLDHGFEGRLLLRGPERESVPNANVRALLFEEIKRFSNNGSSSSKSFIKVWDLKSDASGLVRLPNAINLEMEWTVVAPGYQEDDFRRKLTPDVPVEIALTPARPSGGRILDAVTGAPIKDAELIMVHWGIGNHRHSFGDPRRENGVVEPYRVYTRSDSDGKFVLDMLRDKVAYTFFVRASDGRCAALQDVKAGETEPREVLIPVPIQVTGKVIGDISKLNTTYLQGKQRPYVSWVNPLGEGVMYTLESPITPDADGGIFEIRNLVPGKLELTISDRKVKLDVEKSITDLTIDLTSPDPSKNPRP